jgi:hypothetical protein
MFKHMAVPKTKILAEHINSYIFTHVEETASPSFETTEFNKAENF